MKIIDLSEKIKQGIWTYGEMYPNFVPRQIIAGDNIFFCEVFDGFTSQTGTYLETTAHVKGYEGNTMIEDIDVSRLVNVPCSVIHLDPKKFSNGGKVTDEDFVAAIEGQDINKGDAILFCCGWSDWYAPDFLNNSPCLSVKAMEWLLSFEPCILGSDIPCWQNEENVFNLFSQTETLLLAPLVNLEQVTNFHVKLTVLPINITSTCCVPARAIIIEE
jgi:kynurenine formamidase